MSIRTPAAQASAARNGASLEADLDRFHLTLCAAGWYQHRKWPKGPQRKKGPPDYLLCTPAGRGVLFDAKSIRSARWPVSLLDAHQYADLRAFSGTAGIYLRLAGGDRWIPFPVVAPVWLGWYRAGLTGAAASLGADDGYPVVGCDWTPYVR